ncbi:MAG: hypothetical protein NC206_08050 [Bacteroides sp.]|nr:hypothetical protein [Roseburia sp.]MCM1347021.1 hypothetical protein [Bacteroides sp.]MCM1420328.1 hypothetical protein [Bacteroides sp.]
MKYLVVILSLCLSLVSEAQTYEWSSLPFGGAGFVSGLVTCPQEKGLMYARTDVGGAYRWNPEDESWIPITDFLPESKAGLLGIESLAIDPSSPNKLYLYCGTSYFNNGLSAILYSEDYGDTFKQIATVTGLFPAHGNDYGRQSGERLAVCPENGNVLLCGSRTRGMWKSENAGKTWKRMAVATFVNDRKVAFVQYADSAKVVAGILNRGENNLFLSEDGGETWKALEGQRTDYMPNRCRVSADGNTLYVTYSDSEGPSTGGSGALMKLDFLTGLWTDISPQPVSFGDISVAQDNPDHLMAVSMGLWWGQYWATSVTTWGDQIWISKNGGKTWTNLMENGRATYSEKKVKWMSTSCQLHWCGCAQMDPFDSSRAYFTSGNGIVSTANLWAGKPRFSMCVTGLEETVPLSIVSVKDAPLAVTLGDYDGCLYSDISEYQKRFSPSMGTTAAIAVAGNNPRIMLRAASDLYYSSNMGVSWVKKNMPVNGVGLSHCAVSADGNILVVTPSGMVPYYSVDSGKTWTELSGAPSGTAIFADPVNDYTFYGMSGNTFYMHFLDIASGTVMTKTKTVANVTGRMCVVGGMAGEVWLPKGTNGLAHLSGCDTGTPSVKNVAMNLCTCVGVGKPQKEGDYPSIYIWGRKTASQKTGLYRSDNTGSKWERINDELHQFGGPGNAQIVTGDMNEYGRVYMSSVGRGVITGKLIVPEVDGIEQIEEDGFLPAVADNACAIYNMGGTMLYQGRMASLHSVCASLPSGIYIIKSNDKSIKIRK